MPGSSEGSGVWFCFQLAAGKITPGFVPCFLLKFKNSFLFPFVEANVVPHVGTALFVIPQPQWERKA